jgi:hypothetical protein
MTLQEKIDKLPLSIEYEGKLYEINFLIYKKYVKLQYWFQPSDPYDNVEKLFGCENENTLDELSNRLEDVVDRALKVIENEEWENE